MKGGPKGLVEYDLEVADGLPERINKLTSSKEEWRKFPSAKLEAFLRILDHHLSGPGKPALKTSERDLTEDEKEKWFEIREMTTEEQTLKQQEWRDIHSRKSYAREDVPLVPVPETAPHSDSSLDHSSQDSHAADSQLAEITEEELPAEKIIVFSMYPYIFSGFLVKLLALHGIKNVAILEGKASVKKREEEIQKFKTDPTCRVLLMSMVGSVGLNLPVASTMILLVCESLLI
jgi:SNF2 family DNA or RNA helicase